MANYRCINTYQGSEGVWHFHGEIIPGFVYHSLLQEEIHNYEEMAEEVSSHRTKEAEPWNRNPPDDSDFDSGPRFDDVRDNDDKALDVDRDTSFGGYDGGSSGGGGASSDYGSNDSSSNDSSSDSGGSSNDN